jgi:hypothetical protein
LRSTDGSSNYGGCNSGNGSGGNNGGSSGGGGSSSGMQVVACKLWKGGVSLQHSSELGPKRGCGCVLSSGVNKKVAQCLLEASSLCSARERYVLVTVFLSLELHCLRNPNYTAQVHFTGR